MLIRSLYTAVFVILTKLCKMDTFLSIAEYSDEEQILFAHECVA